MGLGVVLDFLLAGFFDLRAENFVVRREGCNEMGELLIDDWSSCRF